MDRSHLVFLKVAETGNLTAASKELRIAQPSLTRTITKLEENFGTRLFNRLPRGMELTPAGTTLRRHLLEMNAIFQRAQKDVEAERSGHYGTIRIGAGLVYQLLFVPKVLQRMLVRFPGTNFDVSTGSASDHAKALLDGELDIVISAAVHEFNNPSLDVRVLGTVTHGIVYNQGTTLPSAGHSEPIPLESLLDLNWVLLRCPDMNMNIEQSFFRAGLSKPRVVITTTSLQIGLDMVRDQGLVMSLPTMFRERLERDGLTLRTTKEPIWTFKSGIALHRPNRDHPALSALIEEFDSCSKSLFNFS